MSTRNVLRMIIFLFITCPSVLLATRERETGCPLGQFPCGNMSECLPQVLQCNGHKDCPNGADEQGCGESTHSHSLETLEVSPHTSPPLKLSLKPHNSAEGHEVKPGFGELFHI